MELDRIIPDKLRSCSLKVLSTFHYAIFITSFHFSISFSMLESKAICLSSKNLRAGKTENEQESVYEQERELREMKRDEICNKYFLLFITFSFGWKEM